MPWKIISLAQGRLRLVKELLKAQKTVQELSRFFGVSRKTAYKWKARFMEGGRRSLRDRPRRPCHSPRRMSALWRKRIKAMRGRHRRWGGKKIRARLRELHPGQRVPAVRTMTRWLGALERRQRTAPTFAQRAGDPAPEADHSQASQCGVDSGFQRVVVHCRWQSSRTVDRTRFVQPLSFGDTSFARPEMVASKNECLSGFFDGMECPKSFEWTMEGLLDRPGRRACRA